jgi:aldose 1-epimerase
MPDLATDVACPPEIALTSAAGLRLTAIPLGARITGLWAPDRTGRRADIVLGHDRPQDYATQHGYLGATCGRHANRIAGARFPLDGAKVRLEPNEGANQLHGGPGGFDSLHWEVAGQSPSQVSFALVSPAGDMGYPGTLTARCTYRLQGLCLWIEMTAVTDAPTVVNLAHHSYFNLGGQESGDVLGHRLEVAAAHRLEVDEQKLPTGAVLPVAGTAFDLRTGPVLGGTLPGPEGFDHCFCLSDPVVPVDGALMRPAARLVHPGSGRSLALMTNQPGLQVYTGHHFEETPGKAGAVYRRFAGIALETQGFPDAPNHPHFPPTRLEPGQTYRHLMRIDLTPLP